MKILIVDDEQETLDMLEIFLQSLEHTVIKASTAKEGIRQLALSEPDTVFLDIHLPDMDGLEVLKEMRKINNNIQIVMITGYKDAEKVIEVFRYGALDCLLKPFNFDYIKNLLPQIRMRTQK